VHLHHYGAGMGTIGLLISAHIAAMYLPSPVTGWLADVLGGRVVAGIGALLLLAAGAVAAVAGAGRPGIIVALLLLGVGWNAGLIGGSALLHDAAVSPSLRTRAEGLGELGMGAAAFRPTFTADTRLHKHPLHTVRDQPGVPQAAITSHPTGLT
jgi:MFS family permease